MRMLRLSLLVTMSVVNATTEPLLTLHKIEGIPDCEIFLADSTLPGSACMWALVFILCHTVYAFVVVACGCVHNDNTL